MDCRLAKPTLIAGALCASLSAFAATPAKAQDYDMDCKVILCLAGGFPTGCADAYSYMMDRISRVPPLPPFGHCAMSNGAAYTGARLDYQFLDGSTPAGWDCIDGRTNCWVS